MDDFISIKESEPKLFDLCDVKINGSDSISAACRYLKHDDGTVAWLSKRCSMSSDCVSHWRLNSLHSDELTKEWLRSGKPLSDYPELKGEDIPTITHNFLV